MLSDRRHCMTPFTGHSEKDTTTVTVNREVVARVGWTEGMIMRG